MVVPLIGILPERELRKHLKHKYILDACGLIAFIYNEPGAEIVKHILKEAANGNTKVYMNKLNFFEVFYGIRREEGLNIATSVYDTVLKLPIEIIASISDEVFFEASRIKSAYPMSLADSIALGEASTSNASLITSDHHEFDIVAEKENIQFTWVR